MAIIVLWLIAFYFLNVSFNAEDSDKGTAIEYAVTLGHAQIVEELLIYGANVMIGFIFACNNRSIRKNYVPFEFRLVISRMLIMWKGNSVLEN